MKLQIIVADTSVLINFLRIDRMDLIGRYPGRLLATDHVESELADDYPEQKVRYAAAVAAGFLDTCSVTDPAEVALFLRLGPGVRLGAGECSAISVALTRGYAIAIDDRRAIKSAVREAELAGAKLPVLRTQDIIVALIRASVLTLDEADPLQSRVGAQPSVPAENLVVPGLVVGVNGRLIALRGRPSSGLPASRGPAGRIGLLGPCCLVPTGSMHFSIPDEPCLARALLGKSGVSGTQISTGRSPAERTLSRLRCIRFVPACATVMY